ncbi:MAG: GTP 3',8-cyclase MoaA [Clostridium sp.]
MQDNYKRNIDYCRISLTEKCNLRCIYCMPEGYKPLSDSEMSLNEIISIVKSLSKIGIKKIRFTGGEPLVRPDIVDIIRETKKVDGIEDVAITTNGVLLKKHLQGLYEAGLTRMNVSLDSLKDETFKTITGASVSGILDSIKKAMELGIYIKINMLPMKGYNEDEIIDFINLTRDIKMDVRFIELMPMGPAKDFKGIKSDDILNIIESMNLGYESIGNEGTGPANLFKIDGYKGRVGVISPMSHNFCHLCNRIRITSDKKLKTCLHNSGEIDLSEFIDNEEGLTDALRSGILKKYKKHTLNQDKISKSGRDMVRIGG